MLECPSPFLRDLNGHEHEEVGRMGVAKAVESDPRHILHAAPSPAHEKVEFITQRHQGMHIAISAAANEGGAGLPDAELQQLLGLTGAIP